MPLLKAGRTVCSHQRIGEEAPGEAQRDEGRSLPSLAPPSPAPVSGVLPLLNEHKDEE